MASGDFDDFCREFAEFLDSYNDHPNNNKDSHEEGDKVQIENNQVR